MVNQGDAAVQIQPGTRSGIRFSDQPYQHLGNLFDPTFAARPEPSIDFISVHDNLCPRARILARALVRSSVTAS